MRGASRRSFAPFALLAIFTASCGNLLGLGDFEDQAETSGAGGATSTTTSETTSTTGTGGDGGATSTSSATTGTGGAGGSFCTPQETMPCYSGPAGTEGVGVCKAGTATCDEDGQAYGACVGEMLPQIEDCATKVDEDCAPDCAEYQWGLTLGDQNEEFGNVIAMDALGNTYVSGSFAGTTKIGSNVFTAVADYDTFLAKLDPNGNVVWAKHYGSINYVSVADAKVDPQNNVVIAGGLADVVDFGGKTLSAPNGAGYAAKIDPQGNCLWGIVFGSGGGDFADSLAIDPVGNIFITGSFVGPINQIVGSVSAVGGQDAFVIKLDPNGVGQWVKGFGGSQGDFGLGIAVDGGGNVIATGLFRGAVSFVGGPTLTASNSGNGYIVKLDALGNHVWSKLVPGTPSSTVNAVAADNAGRVYATGSFQGSTDLGGGMLTSAGSTDVFLVQYDGAGAHQWSKRFGGSGSDSGGLVVLDGPQHAIFSGGFNGSIDLGLGPLIAVGTFDVFLARIDEMGSVLWNRTLEYGAGVAMDGQGAMFLAGSFGTSIDLGGPTPLLDAGSGDMFAAKLARPMPRGVP